MSFVFVALRNRYGRFFSFFGGRDLVIDWITVTKTPRGCG